MPEPFVSTVCAPPEGIGALTASSALTLFRPAVKQHQALVEIASSPQGCVSTVQDGTRLIAYAAFHPPTEVESWGADRTGELIELGAVEVDPGYRGHGLARRILAASFAGGRFDHTIVFATLYVWHYDLKRTDLSDFQYRRMLERMYRSVGLEPFRTADPEIRSNAANSLMARIGSHCPAHVRREFDRLRGQQLSRYGI